MGYVDPNLFGLLSQLGLAVVLVAGVVLTFFRASIQRFLGVKPKNKDAENNKPVEKN